MKYDFREAITDYITSFNRKRDAQDMIVIGFVTFLMGYLLAVTVHNNRIIKPVPDDYVPTYPTIEQTVPSPTPTPAKEALLRGTASYYSEAGCLGCSDTLTMANGERLDDTKHTLAVTVEDMHKYKLLNDIVTVTNIHTGKSIEAKITDTGGFAKYTRVADLSMATRDAIGCSDLCEVEITQGGEL